MKKNILKMLVLACMTALCCMVSKAEAKVYVNVSVGTPVVVRPCPPPPCVHVPPPCHVHHHGRPHHHHHCGPHKCAPKPPRRAPHPAPRHRHPHRR